MTGPDTLSSCLITVPRPGIAPGPLGTYLDQQSSRIIPETREEMCTWPFDCA